MQKNSLRSTVLFTLFTSTVLNASTVSLKSVNGSSTSSKYLEYSLSGDVPNGTYKIWNMSQNRQVGADRKKTRHESASELVSIAAERPGDKYAVLNSDGEVLSSFTSAGGGAGGGIDFSKPRTASTNSSDKKNKKNIAQITLKKQSNPPLGANEQIETIKKATSSYRRVQYKSSIQYPEDLARGRS